MFGYVTINQSDLTEAEKTRYQAYYCGLCRALQSRHGNIGRMTLSYDMTFLYVLLSSLYEPEEKVRDSTCILHPVKPRANLQNEIAAYAADMNIALAYHKCIDDWHDERKPVRWMESNLLAGAYRKVAAAYPEKCRVLEETLQALSALEKTGVPNVDTHANLTARMLGEIYVFRPGDPWEEDLRATGEGLGRFIYLMDAYEDFPEDRDKKRYNPLVKYAGRDDYEALCREGLSMMIAECTDAFEVLPLERDLRLLRNILYSGVWTRYTAIQRKKNEAIEKEETA